MKVFFVHYEAGRVPMHLVAKHVEGGRYDDFAAAPGNHGDKECSYLYVELVVGMFHELVDGAAWVACLEAFDVEGVGVVVVEKFFCYLHGWESVLVVCVLLAKCCTIVARRHGDGHCFKYACLRVTKYATSKHALISDLRWVLLIPTLSCELIITVHLELSLRFLILGFTIFIQPQP